MRIVRAGAERVDDLEPLWGALQEHHAELARGLDGLEARAPADAWAHRRASYARWLGEPEAFVLLAEDAVRPVGYALVRVGEGFASFGPAERIASVETLAVLAEARGRGVGTALMDTVEREVGRLGVTRLRLTVVDGNDDARRFYARRGMAAVSHVLMAEVSAR